MKKVTKEQHKNNLRQLIITDKKFDAIKYLRNITKLSLKESKELVDLFFIDPTKLDDYTLKIKTEVTIDSELNKKDMNSLNKFLLKGEKINAVKYVKELLNCSLKDAKNLVDLLQTKLKKSEVFLNGKYQSTTANESEEEQEPNAGTDSTENFS